MNKHSDIIHSAARTKGERAAASRTASAGVAVLLILSGTALLGVSAYPILAETKGDPSPESIKDWLAVFAYLAGLILLVVNLVKAFRPDPSADKKFCTKDEAARIETDSKARAQANSTRIEKLESNHNSQHRENVERLSRLEEKLDNYRADEAKARDAFLKDVRHDVRNELQPLQNAVSERTRDAEEQFRALARDIGGLRASNESNAALAAEVRLQLTNVLQRLPAGGARS